MPTSADEVLTAEAPFFRRLLWDGGSCTRLDDADDDGLAAADAAALADDGGLEDDGLADDGGLVGGARAIRSYLFVDRFLDLLVGVGSRRHTPHASHAHAAKKRKGGIRTNRLSSHGIVRLASSRSEVHHQNATYQHTAGNGIKGDVVVVLLWLFRACWTSEGESAVEEEE